MHNVQALIWFRDMQKTWQFPSVVSAPRMSLWVMVTLRACQLWQAPSGSQAPFPPIHRAPAKPTSQSLSQPPLSSFQNLSAILHNDTPDLDSEAVPLFRCRTTYCVADLTNGDGFHALVAAGSYPEASEDVLEESDHNLLHVVSMLFEHVAVHICPTYCSIPCNSIFV